jgi:predicted Zn-dependent protease
LKLLSGILLIVFVLCGCASSPTGRKQLTLLGSGQMDQMGDQSFEELKKKQPQSKDPKQTQYVRCITDRLLTTMGENPSEWEILVFKDESPNAFALPGKNMGVHTGMLSLAKNQHQLAAVIGHEIGHVLANHGNERVSQGLLAQAGLTAADLFLGRDSQSDQLIVAALGVGAQFGVLMPFSRKHETEADRLGLKYMSEAGFDPRQAAELWKLMSGGGKSPPEFLSTHPSPESRIKDLGGLAPSYMPVYEGVSPKPNCG